MPAPPLSRSSRETLVHLRFAVSQLELELTRIVSRIGTVDSERAVIARKNDNDNVVELDLVLEEKVIALLRVSFPEHAILSEEAGTLGPPSDFQWIVDPLCGSNNYHFGLPMFGSSIALAFRNELVYRLIVLPTLGETLAAWKGEGAFRNGTRLAAVAPRPLSEALILYDNQLAQIPEALSGIGRVTERAFAFRITGSAAWDTGMVATGRADARIFHSTKVFDFAAAAVIVPEVGGTVCEFSGAPVDLASTQLIVAAHAQLGDSLARALRE